MADDPVQRARESGKPPTVTDPLVPAPPPGDGGPDAPRAPKTRSREGFGDSEGELSPLDDADDGDSDY